MVALDALIAAAAEGDLDRVAERHGVRLLGVFGSTFRLYERDAGAWATGQMAALAERRDTEHLRRLDLDALTER